MRELEIDIETYSSVSLQKCGVYKYAESPDFEILLFGYSADGGEVSTVDIASGEKLPDDVLAANGITSRAGYDDPGAVDAVSTKVSESLDEATAAVQDAIKAVTGETVDKTTALEELIEAAESIVKEGGEQ